MKIIPAIDVLDGKIVRLQQGIMEEATKYYDDPLSFAKLLADKGVKHIHLVDLDSARGDFDKNSKIISAIIKEVDIEIEIGGGVRTLQDADRLINIGAKYIIIGTVAVKKPEMAEIILDKYTNSVIIGIDARNEFLATDGWYSNSVITVFEIIDRYSCFDYSSIIYTDITKDGMLKGLNTDMIVKVADYAKRNIIASGGVSSVEDIKSLIALGNPYISGCIVGKALYEGKITVDDILMFDE